MRRLVFFDHIMTASARIRRKLLSSSSTARHIKTKIAQAENAVYGLDGRELGLRSSVAQLAAGFEQQEPEVKSVLEKYIKKCCEDLAGAMADAVCRPCGRAGVLGDAMQGAEHNLEIMNKILDNPHTGF